MPLLAVTRSNMKVLGVCLLAFVVAVQARSTGVEIAAQSTSENPWVVHLRIAVSTSGQLNSCVGSLIDNRWVLTAASCMETVRYVWLRYGADNVINPKLVTETSTARTLDDVALISINRAVEYTDNIKAVALASIDDEVPATATLCGYGAAQGSPGEQLVCSEWTLEPLEDGTILGTSEDVPATQYDIGAPLVSNGVQIGVLVRLTEGLDSAVFVNPANYRDWIEGQTGIEL